MKNVYGYVRVSTTRQGLGVSLEVQQETIERFAAQNNFKVAEWFVEKVTAAKTGRPLFTQLVKQLRAKLADGVIMHKIDRSARNLKDWSILTDLIESDPNMEVHFAHESFDLRSRGGRLAGDIQAAVAADFIRNNRQETCKGLDGRLNQGIWPFPAPAGYVDNGKGKYKTIHKIQGPLVRKAFELYATNQYTLETLCAHMNALGMKNVNKGTMKPTALSNILNNPFYMGILKSKRGTFSGGHKPLISPELFQRVHNVLTGNTNQKIVRHEYQFRKQVTCSVCGYILTAERQKDIVYYRCHTKNCITKGLRESAIKNMLTESFALVQFLPEENQMIDALLTEIESKWTTKQEELFDSVKLQLDNAQERLERVTDCYVEGGLDKNGFEKRKHNILIEIKEREVALNELKQDKEHIFNKARKFFELAKNLINSYETANVEKKRKIVETTTSNLSAEGKKLIISMRSPFLEMSERNNIHSCAPIRSNLRKKEHSFVELDKFVVGAPIRSRLRKKYDKLVCPDNTGLKRKSLTREQLRHLINVVLGIVAKLPNDNDFPTYDI